jgi:hypothetical protein
VVSVAEFVCGGESWCVFVLVVDGLVVVYAFWRGDDSDDAGAVVCSGVGVWDCWVGGGGGCVVGVGGWGSGLAAGERGTARRNTRR